jgi:hypothetical protein
MRVGYGVSAFRSTLLMDTPVGIEQLATTLTWERHFGPRHTLQVGGGPVLAGALTWKDFRYAMGRGATASVGYSYLLVQPKGAVPFVMLSASIAGTNAPTGLGRYWALDLRGSVAAGWLLFDRWTPYAAARVFGGPVAWNGQVGGDRYHVQLGAGFVLGLPAGFDFTFEVVPLGEQSISGGIGFSF